MGRKTARRLGSLMILLGVIGVISSIAWWENFYSPLAGQPPVECLYQFTGPCRTVSDIAGFFGAAAYDARLLGRAVLSVSLGFSCSGDRA
jgi:hypothetical protein